MLKRKWMSLQRAGTLTVFLTLALISTTHSGCARSASYIEPCGADDFIKIPSGAKVNNVKLDYVDSNNPVTVTTQKAGVWASLECWDRIEKGK